MKRLVPTFGSRVFEFYQSLDIPVLPDGISAMNPHKNKVASKYVRRFVDKFYSDNEKRTLVFGINPGRFGAGLTGITFTDPKSLFEECGIKNDLPKVRELSAEYVYKFINSWGGPKKFYGKFFLTALSPLGFTKGGKNYNFYDDKKLEEAITPFIIESTWKQIELGCQRNSAIILGAGKNLKFFTKINKVHKFFDKIYALEHPRFILQYRRKDLPEYLKKYVQTFTKSITG